MDKGGVMYHMKTTTDFIAFVLYADTAVLDKFCLDYKSSFIASRNKELAEYDWNAKARSLHKLSKLSIRELLEIRFLSRRKISTEFDVTDYLAKRMIQMSKLLQVVGEMELYGLYMMDRHGKYIAKGTLAEVEPYIRFVAENVESKPYREKFLAFLESKNL